MTIEFDKLYTKTELTPELIKTLDEPLEEIYTEADEELEKSMAEEPMKDLEDVTSYSLRSSRY